MTSSIEFAQSGDGEAICRVTAETWVETYQNEEYGITEEMIRGNQYQSNGELRADYIELTERAIALNGAERAIYVAKQNGDIVGVISVAPFREQNRKKIRTLFVLPSHQGSGKGAALLEHGLAWEPGLATFLNVAVYNRRAIEIYKRRGFHITGRVEDPAHQITFNNGVVLPEYFMFRSGDLVSL